MHTNINIHLVYAAVIKYESPRIKADIDFWDKNTTIECGRKDKR